MAPVRPASVDGISVSDIVIAVIGVTGSGKTTFISSLLGEDVGIGHGLVSETASVTTHLFTHLSSGKRVFLLDTPGFNDTWRDDAEILRDLAFVLTQLYRRSVLVSGLIYCHDITRNRFEGSHVKMLHVFREAIGPAAYGHVVLLSTKWETLEPRNNEARNRAVAREAELVGTGEFWGDLCYGGATSKWWDGSRTVALEVVDHVEMLQGRLGKPTLRIQSEMVDEGKELHETSAGRVVLGALLEAERKFCARMAELKAEFDGAMKRKDGEHAAEVKRQRGEMEAKMAHVTQSQGKLLVSQGQLSDQKIDEYMDKMGRLQSKIVQLEARMRENNSSPGQHYHDPGGRPDCSYMGNDDELAPLRRQHSRLVKAQLALNLLGLLAGIGVSVAGGVTGNMGLLTTGLSMVGGSLTSVPIR